MKIDEFLKEYKIDHNCIYGCVKDRYVPIEEKQARAKAIVESSHYITNEDGTRQFHVNTTAMYMMTALTLVDLFTDIERNDDMVSDFNTLNQLGLFRIIENRVSKYELEEFRNILHWEEKDLMKNEYEIGGYIQKQVERFALLFGNVLAPVIQELDTEKLSAVLDKIKE